MLLHKEEKERLIGLIRKDNEDWGAGYKRSDFIPVLGPFYDNRKYREFSEITIVASKASTVKDIRCDKCFSIIGQLISQVDFIEKVLFVSKFGDIEREMAHCSCGRCFVKICILALKDRDNKPTNDFHWHLVD